MLYLFSRKINLGSIVKDTSISEEEVKLVEMFSKNIDMQDIGLFWQLTIKTIEDLNIVGNENLTLEMFIMQLTHLKSVRLNNEVSEINEDLNDQGYKKNLISKEMSTDEKESSSQNQIKNQLKNTDQIKSNPIKNLSSKTSTNELGIKSFQDLIDRANKEKEVELKFDLERNVKLVSFKKGKIDISFNEKLNKNFIKLLTEKLLLWTGKRWIISLSKNSDAKSIYEKNLENKSSSIKDFLQSDIAQQIQKTFPDAKLIDIKEEDNE